MPLIHQVLGVESSPCATPYVHDYLCISWHIFRILPFFQVLSTLPCSPTNKQQPYLTTGKLPSPRVKISHENSLSSFRPPSTLHLVPVYGKNGLHPSPFRRVPTKSLAVLHQFHNVITKHPDISIHVPNNKDISLSIEWHYDTAIIEGDAKDINVSNLVGFVNGETKALPVSSLHVKLNHLH